MDWKHPNIQNKPSQNVQHQQCPTATCLQFLAADDGRPTESGGKARCITGNHSCRGKRVNGCTRYLRISGAATVTMASPGAVEKRQPVFTTIDQLRPDTSGHNLKVKVSGALLARWGLHAE